MGAGGREAAGAPAGAGRARREGEWEAAAREARAAAVSAAHAELAAALQDELQEAQQHQAATEARLREMAAALKRLRDEPATTCAE